MWKGRGTGRGGGMFLFLFLPHCLQDVSDLSTCPCPWQICWSYKLSLKRLSNRYTFLEYWTRRIRPSLAIGIRLHSARWIHPPSAIWQTSNQTLFNCKVHGRFISSLWLLNQEGSSPVLLLYSTRRIHFSSLFRDMEDPSPRVYCTRLISFLNYFFISLYIQKYIRHIHWGPLQISSSTLMSYAAPSELRCTL